MAKDVLEDRKVFKLKSLYKEVLKTFKIDEKHEVSGAKTEISSEPLALNFFKMVFAMVALSIGLLSFFQANYFENKLKSVDTYTLNVLSVNNEKFDNLFNLVNESVSSSVVQSIFEKISSAIIFTKMSFSLSQFILDFGKNWFFMPLLPLFFTFLSLYFAFGMKNKISRKFYGVARIFFVFAFLLRFFVPLNSYVLAKTDEYALNTVYEQGYKSFKSYVENDKKSDKKAKQQSESLEKQTIKTSGDMLAILYLKSLILPLLILLTFKRFLSFK
ncbi:MAG: hypothetical protein BWY78_00736 [Alphaproteobacteria bacterium ADurb.Bin438]|nr:MAG: hypothetical protein BWY78_00736 [Alphaproteobacteria bacterium ADurb.Bin438]